jgi:hypothetical protein
MTTTTTGRCLCGDLVYAFTGDPLWVAYCHCDSCRRQTSSAVATFVGLDATRFGYTHGKPAVHASSPGVARSFCGRCGSPMSFEGAKWPGEIHIYIGTLSDPAAFVPTGHVHVAEKLPWFEIADTLPRHLASDAVTPPATARS